MLTLIGLGLGDVKDITLNGLEAIRNSDQVFLEAYTSILCGGETQKQMEELYGKPVIAADRDTVEADANEILDQAATKNVSFLVVGDVFGATTHTDLVLRAKERGIEYRVIHNASIITAIGCCGLQLYSFGEIVSIPLWSDSWQPTSFVDKIESNMRKGLHTLCLLDIKVKERSIEAMMRGKEEYEPARFMTVSVAAQQILDSLLNHNKDDEHGLDETKKLEPNSNHILTSQSKCVGLARVGAVDQRIAYCDLKKMAETDLGSPLHCLVIVGKTHPLETAMLQSFLF